MCPPLEAAVFHAPFSQPSQASVRDARLPSSLAASLFATVFPGLLGVPEGKHRPILLSLYCQKGRTQKMMPLTFITLNRNHPARRCIPLRLTHVHKSKMNPSKTPKPSMLPMLAPDHPSPPKPPACSSF